VLCLQLDYDGKDSSYNRIESLVNEELKQYFRPEFLNRLDEIIVFRQLSKTEVKEIADIMLKEVFERLREGHRPAGQEHKPLSTPVQYNSTLTAVTRYR